MQKRVLVFLISALVLLTVPVNSPAQQDNNVYLEAIGGFLGSHMYTTFAYIGVTADAYAKEIYPASKVKFEMEYTANSLKELIGKLKRVQATNLAESDKKYIKSAVEVFEVLLEEAQLDQSGSVPEYRALVDP